jgi:hypothetical protein
MNEKKASDNSELQAGDRVVLINRYIKHFKNTGKALNCADEKVVEGIIKYGGIILSIPSATERFYKVKPDSKEYDDYSWFDRDWLDNSFEKKLKAILE